MRSSIRTLLDFAPIGFAMGLVYSIFLRHPTCKFENVAGLLTVLALKIEDEGEKSESGGNQSLPLISGRIKILHLGLEYKSR